ncbi:MAG: hypothetical protein IJ770_02680 [Alphaproteobacteria bacterium]|nr:hypothetical protein [Alphaproteobacteria bacterium]
MAEEDDMQYENTQQTVQAENETPEEIAAEQEDAADDTEQMIMLEQWTDETLFERALVLLQTSAQNNENIAAYYRYLQVRNFGEDVSEEVAKNATLEDERQQALVAEFLRDKLDGIKSDAVSLDKTKVNKAFENIFALVGMDLNTETTSESHYDKVFQIRTAQIPDLRVDYQILQLNRSIADMYAAKASTAELNGKIMLMEDWYSNGDINREQLAQFYYNIAMMYEANTTKQNTTQAVNREHFRAISYEKMALEKTNTNINLIINVRREWQDNYDYDPQKILDACHRVIDNSGDKRNVFRAHKLYAEALLDFTGTDGFGMKREKRINTVIKHYRRALAYAEQPEEKVDILNAIADQQKRFDKNGYIETRMEVADLLTGRARIREFEKIANETDNQNLKVSALKAGINEFDELPGIDNEDRYLYDDFDRKLRVALPEDANKGKILKSLDELKKKFGTPEQKKEEMLLPIMSSGGKDFFSGR